MYTDEELEALCAQTDDAGCLTCRAWRECRDYMERHKEMPCRRPREEEEATIICDGQSLSQLS